MADLEHRLQGLPAQKLRLLAQRLRQKNAAKERPASPFAPHLARHGVPGPVPVSFQQRRLWFIDQLASGSSFYNVVTAVRLSGSLELAVVRRTLDEIVRRHEVLRTSFSSFDGEPVQTVEAPRSVKVAMADLTHLGEEGGAVREARRLAAEEAHLPFDLTSGSLVRAKLLQLGASEHVLLLTLHHIIADRWSVGILIRELSVLYQAFSEGRPSPLPELPLQYADFAVWQRQWLQGEVLERELDYWRGQLADAEDLLQLPTDHPRPEVQGFRGASLDFELSQELGASLIELGQREGCSLFMLLLGAFQTLLHHYSGAEHVAVGSNVGYRNWPQVRDLIGFFANILVLRTRFSGDPTFRQILRRVRETSLKALVHQHLPFDKLVEAIRPVRHLAHNPLFQVAFELDSRSTTELPEGRLTVSRFEFEVGTAQFDLGLRMSEFGGRLEGAFDYRTDLFEQSTVSWLAEQLERLLGLLVERPDRCLHELRESLAEAERERQDRLKASLKEASSRKLIRGRSRTGVVVHR